MLSANSSVKTLQRRVRRGSMKRNRHARETPKPEVTPTLREGSRENGAEAWSPVAAEEIVRLVVIGVLPVRATVDGVNRQTARAGSPPVQAKVMVDWKPAVGVAVRVIGLEVPPWVALVEVVDCDKVKAPAGPRMVRVTGAEVLA